MSPARLTASFALSLAATACLTAAAIAGPISTQFTLDGSVVTPGTYDLAALSGLPATTQTVTYTAAGVPVTDTYTGTNLWTLVNSAGGFTPAPGVKNSTLRNYVVAVGSDGYQAGLLAARSTHSSVIGRAWQPTPIPADNSAPAGRMALPGWWYLATMPAGAMCPIW